MGNGPSPTAAAPGVRLRARATPHATVFEAEPGPYLRLDAAGRWTAFGEGGATWRRALDGRVLRAGAGGWRACSVPQARAVHGAVRDAVARFARGLGDGQHDLLAPAEVLATCLARAATWTPARLEAHGARLREAWPEAVPILPPHRYRDLVVLPATGCPHGACSFCTLHRGRPYRVLDDGAFRRHLEAVRAVLGGAAAERDGLFLGSASALSLPDALLLRRLARLRAVFGAPRRGVASFLDPDHAPARAERAWRRLAAAGLADVTVGLETGDPALRAALGKSPDVGRFVARARALKRAALRVNVTLLVGLGDAAREDAHRAASAAALAALDLAADDTVYLSPWTRAGAGDFAPGEEAAWRATLEPATAARVRPYRVGRFAWLT